MCDCNKMTTDAIKLNVKPIKLRKFYDTQKHPNGKVNLQANLNNE